MAYRLGLHSLTGPGLGTERTLSGRPATQRVRLGGIDFRIESLLTISRSLNPFLFWKTRQHRVLFHFVVMEVELEPGVVRAVAFEQDHDRER